MYFSAMNIGCVDIASRSSARGRQTETAKQVFIHTQLSRAYLALARLSCNSIVKLFNITKKLGTFFYAPPGICLILAIAFSLFVYLCKFMPKYGLYAILCDIN